MHKCGHSKKTLNSASGHYDDIYLIPFQEILFTGTIVMANMDFKSNQGHLSCTTPAIMTKL